jgi:hypothetical protein
VAQSGHLSGFGYLEACEIQAVEIERYGDSPGIAPVTLAKSGILAAQLIFTIFVESS